MSKLHQQYMISLRYRSTSEKYSSTQVATKLCLWAAFHPEFTRNHFAQILSMTCATLWHIKLWILSFPSKSLSIPGCLEKVWDSQDFHMSFAGVSGLFVLVFFKWKITDKTLQPLTLYYWYNLYLLYPQILFPWTTRKMLTKLVNFQAGLW